MKFTDASDLLWADIGGRIKTLRRDNNLSQRQLADAIGLSRVSISNIELGKQRLVLDLLYRIAEVLDVNICTLLGESGTIYSRVSVLENTKLRNRVADLERLLHKYRVVGSRLIDLEQQP